MTKKDIIKKIDEICLSVEEWEKVDDFNALIRAQEGLVEIKYMLIKWGSDLK
jgi:cell fate (sporulation/competence/biofilm development) regulator YmcA (YheA/YmcA/DUF963 family)